MQLNATFKELSLGEKQTYLQNKIYFNCRKAGHIARNCYIGGNPSRNNSRNRRRYSRGEQREQLNATLITEPIIRRGGYIGTMQICAILRGLASDEEVTTIELRQRSEGIQARLDKLEREQEETIYELDPPSYKETEDSQIIGELP